MRKFGFLILVAAIFAVSTGWHVGNTLRFRGVENWPSAPAEIVETSSIHDSIPMETRTGSDTVRIDAAFTEYTYSVNGIIYQGSANASVRPQMTFSVNGVPPASPELLIRYDPEHPEVSTIYPMPEESDLLLYVAALSGLLLALTVFFTVRN